MVQERKTHQTNYIEDIIEDSIKMDETNYDEISRVDFNSMETLLNLLEIYLELRNNFYSSFKLT